MNAINKDGEKHIFTLFQKQIWGTQECVSSVRYESLSMALISLCNSKERVDYMCECEILVRNVRV